jgi:hypothetical protein
MIADTSTEAVKQLVAKRRSDPWALHLGKQVDNTMLALVAERDRLAAERDGARMERDFNEIHWKHHEAERDRLAAALAQARRETWQVAIEAAEQSGIKPGGFATQQSLVATLRAKAKEASAALAGDTP